MKNIEPEIALIFTAGAVIALGIICNCLSNIFGHSS